jgi:hypothetical protein
MPRWIFIFPLWLTGFFLIAFASFYFAFHAPAIAAMVFVWILTGGGVWALSRHAR